ncbi:hypothetical protein UFOVP112_329 [uncultured Caudovirales phage]|uniref:Uncharacterized protein n=1 Tax=uncultured Caudovirales phage TaxID=2100421 RepID=A0A6J5L4K3_9CAUD|nr:hypothetical protein UFOVP112_329 [uncultured Caudovirales phage]
MDTDQHINQIVQNIVADISSQVQTQATATIAEKIAQVVSAIDCTSMISNQLSQKIDVKLSQLPIDSKTIESELSSRLDTISQNLSASVQLQALKIINESVSKYVNNINFQELYQASIISAIKNKKFVFPDNSVPPSAIQLSDLRISGDQVASGIIKNFGSTGIDDRASACQLTILNDLTVVENNLVTKDLTVKGSTTIEGDLIVTGTMPETSPLFQSVVQAATNNVRTSLDATVFRGYSNAVFNQMREEGIDLTKITVNGNEIISGSNLGNFITSSNLQKVGTLQELRVSGETLLSQTLYVSGKRVGVNTIEPSQALSIWDQEVEIGFGKVGTNTAIIEAPRNQTLIISSNAKNNLILTPDGAVATNKLSVGTVTLSSSPTPPNNDQPIGSIVFNANPTIGGPLGWVSLGGARWANFGFID